MNSIPTKIKLKLSYSLAKIFSRVVSVLAIRNLTTKGASARKGRHMARLRRDRKEKRQREAKQRNERWESMSLEAKLRDLDRRLGDSVGAVKQRGRICKHLHN